MARLLTITWDEVELLIQQEYGLQGFALLDTDQSPIEKPHAIQGKLEVK
jgi:hypothetical protein